MLSLNVMKLYLTTTNRTTIKKYNLIKNWFRLILINKSIILHPSELMYLNILSFCIFLIPFYAAYKAFSFFSLSERKTKTLAPEINRNDVNLNAVVGVYRQKICMYI